ncbi:MAG TPA: AgmX/PglI C-terminal domain-containing protein [Kofleriaceae bacterium]|nr:AgmX/PglI C-terminal domain-containing protein [Kofleriaceae bacterium]
MKRLCLIAVLACPAVASASPGIRPDNLEQPTLSATDVSTYAASYQTAIRACYDTHARGVRGATGELTLRLTIHSNGSPYRLAIRAPGVTGKALSRLDSCILAQVATWHFPVRRGFTDAVLPYLFLRTAAPGAGPLPSCWSPKGCPEKRAKPVAV